MWITPFVQVNVSVSARMVTVILGLLLLNRILFVQEYTVFLLISSQQVPFQNAEQMT